MSSVAVSFSWLHFFFFISFAYTTPCLLLFISASNILQIYLFVNPDGFIFILFLSLNIFQFSFWQVNIEKVFFLLFNVIIVVFFCFSVEHDSSISLLNILLSLESGVDHLIDPLCTWFLTRLFEGIGPQPLPHLWWCCGFIASRACPSYKAALVILAFILLVRNM